MSVSLYTAHSTFEIGSSSFFRSFFDTIEYHLTKGNFGKKYPIVLGEFQNGELKFKNLKRAEAELRLIRKKLKKYAPNKIIWDKYDLEQTPPWGDDISPDITDLSNYHVTSDGKALFEIIFKAIEIAKIEGSDIIIK